MVDDNPYQSPGQSEPEVEPVEPADYRRFVTWALLGIAVPLLLPLVANHYYQPINERWLVLGRVNYSLQDDDLLSAELGFEYDSCCWAVRVVAKRFLRNREGEHRDALYFQLVLKGLGNVGRRSAPLFYDLAD